MIENSKQSQLQNEVVEKALDFYSKNRLGIFNLAMRFGKCKTTIDLWKCLYNYYPTILITYKDNKLEDTWKSELTLWKYNNPNITFVNFSSLKKYSDKIFDFVLVDEFHSTSDNQRQLVKEIINNDKKTKVLLLSGTISKETTDLWKEFTEIVKYDTLAGISDGILADYEVTVHLVDLDTKIKTPNKKGKLLSEKQKYDNYTYVINRFKEEGKDTMHLLLSRNRLSTSSIGKLNYTKKLLEKLKDKRIIVFAGLTKTADSIGIPSYHNKSKDDSNFEKFQSKKINHLALANMGKVGISYVDLDCVILLNATSNPEETSQIINRAIKLDYHNKVADTHIIALNEDAEKKKLKKSLSMLDQNKIKYI